MSSPNNPFEATASTLGYLYQCRYALLLLLERRQKEPTVELSIERFDDIAIERDGILTEQIQTKHHVRRAGDLSNASVDLWKTLRVWSDGIISGTLRPSETMLCLVTTATAPARSAASELRRDNRNEAAALQTLLGVTQTSTNATNAPAYTAFTALTTAQQNALLAAVRILDDEPSIEDVLPRIREQLVYACRPEHLNHLVERVEGWWQAVVVRHLMGGAGGPQPTLRGLELHNKINDIHDDLRRSNLPTDFCFTNVEIVVNPARDGRTFVRQLRVIGHQDGVISNAICDHYKSARQRSEWVRKDLLLMDELEKYEGRLLNEWRTEFAFHDEEYSGVSGEEAAQKAGKELYRWSQQQGIHIRPDCTEPTIARGSFHILADDLRLGWHPRYREVLGEDVDVSMTELNADTNSAEEGSNI